MAFDIDDYSEEMKLAVKRGAYWLDQTYPEWLGMIDLQELDLAGVEKCVLGQVGGNWHYFEAFFAGLDGDDFFAGTRFIVEHGFDIPDELVDEPTAAYDALTIEWQHYIKEART